MIFYFLILLVSLDVDALEFDYKSETTLGRSIKNIHQKNLSKYSRFDEVNGGVALIHSSYWGEGMRLDLRPEVKFINSFAVSLPNTDPGRSSLHPPLRFFNLEKKIRTTRETETYLMLERMKLSYQTDNFEASVGRRPISIGTLKIFSVWNKFSRSSPELIAFPQTVYAQDGAGFRYTINGLTLNTVGVWAESRLDRVILGELIYFGENSEVHLLAGEWWQGTPVGVAISFDLAGMNLRGEGLYFPYAKNFDKDIFQSGIGGEYAFSENWSGLFEIFYQNRGQDKKPYQFGNSNRYTSMLGKQYGFLQLTWKATPLMSLTPSTLINLIDESEIFSMKCDYSWSDNLDFTAAFSKPIGQRGSEFSHQTYLFNYGAEIGSSDVFYAGVRYVY